MGWDAFAMIDERTKKRRPDIMQAFEDASLSVKDDCGCVDGSLNNGCLDVSTCGEMLELATGYTVYPDDGIWTMSQVKLFNKMADWDFQYQKDDEWAYWSAKHFLALCAKFELSIKFSW